MAQRLFQQNRIPSFLNHKRFLKNEVNIKAQQESQFLEYVNKNRKALASQINVQLFQYNYCPFCVKHSIVDVNVVTKQELNFSKYRKVPVAIINGLQVFYPSNLVVDSRLIMSLLESHLVSAISIPELLKLYDLVENTTDISECDVYKIYDDPLFKSEYLKKHRMREHNMRVLINDKLFKLLSRNTFFTLLESINSNSIIVQKMNISSIYKPIIQVLGGPGMYLFTLQRNRKEDDNPRESLFTALREWNEKLDDLSFHGGKVPDLADFDMYGGISALSSYKAYNAIKKNVPEIRDWLCRMDELASYTKNLS